MPPLVFTRTQPRSCEECLQIDEETQVMQLCSKRLEALVYDRPIHRVPPASISLDSCSAALITPDETAKADQAVRNTLRSSEDNSIQAESQLSANAPVLDSINREEVIPQPTELSINASATERTHSVITVSNDIPCGSTLFARIDSEMSSPDEVPLSGFPDFPKEDQQGTPTLNVVAVTSVPLGTATPHASVLQRTAHPVSDNRAILTVPVSSSDIHRFDKGLYVGKMREMPPPSAALSEWEDKIKPRLVKDLYSVLNALPRSLKLEETIMELDLCMSGEASSKSTSVQMMPTIWIRCGSKKCKKAVSRAVSDLGYMRNLSTFQTQIRVRAPKLATSERLRRARAFHGSVFVGRPKPLDCKLEVQKVAPISSVCGLKLRVLQSGDRSDRICTIGGLIRVDDEIYGLTTGHTLVNLGKKMGESTAQSDTSSAHDTSDTDSDCSGTIDDRSDSEDKLPRNSLDVSQGSEYLSSQMAKIQWEPVESLGPTAFAGQGSPVGALDSLSDAIPNSDFALVKLTGDTPLWNNYTIPGTSVTVPVVGTFDDAQLVEGQVWILAGHNEVRKGFLLPSKSVFMQRGALFETRKIQLDSPLAQGTSGAWVVRHGGFCGVYSGEPYIHMLTADRMFADILAFTSCKRINVATSDDLDGRDKVPGTAASLPRAEQAQRNAEKMVAEMRRELQILKAEARRAWEELGRREQEERERVLTLKEGYPIVICGVQVHPTQALVSRQVSGAQGPTTKEGPYPTKPQMQPSTRAQEEAANPDQRHGYEEAPSLINTDPFGGTTVLGGHTLHYKPDVPSLATGTYQPYPLGGSTPTVSRSTVKIAIPPSTTRQGSLLYSLPKLRTDFPPSMPFPQSPYGEVVLRQDHKRASSGDQEQQSDYLNDKQAGGFAGPSPKKKRGRIAPPGRCQSCNRAETSEWRRGPDGAKILCNSCHRLHYAKLSRKMEKNKAAVGGSDLPPKVVGSGSPSV